MNNETLKRDLCARLMEGVKVKNQYGDICTLLSVSNRLSNEFEYKESGGRTDYSSFKGVKPILFPISALTKPIQIASYNNGEPFVPIYELARLFHTISPECIEDYTDAVEHGFYGAQCTCWLSVKEGRCNYFQMPFGDFITSAEHRIIKMLYQWHINIELSPDQFIEVTEGNNPYK